MTPRRRYDRDEPFRQNTTNQAIDNGLLDRWRRMQAAKQAETPKTIHTVTRNEILKDLLDFWDKHHAAPPGQSVFRSLDEARDT